MFYIMFFIKSYIPFSFCVEKRIVFSRKDPIWQPYSFHPTLIALSFSCYLNALIFKANQHESHLHKNHPYTQFPERSPAQFRDYLYRKHVRKCIPLGGEVHLRGSFLKCWIEICRLKRKVSQILCTLVFPNFASSLRIIQVCLLRNRLPGPCLGQSFLGLGNLYFKQAPQVIYTRAFQTSVYIQIIWKPVKQTNSQSPPPPPNSDC